MCSLYSAQPHFTTHITWQRWLAMNWPWSMTAMVVEMSFGVQFLPHVFLLGHGTCEHSGRQSGWMVDILLVKQRTSKFRLGGKAEWTRKIQGQFSKCQGGNLQRSSRKLQCLRDWLCLLLWGKWQSKQFQRLSGRKLSDHASCHWSQEGARAELWWLHFDVTQGDKGPADAVWWRPVMQSTVELRSHSIADTPELSATNKQSHEQNLIFPKFFSSLRWAHMSTRSDVATLYLESSYGVLRRNAF